MSTAATEDDGIVYPITVEAVSLYCRNPAENADKEYHLQVVKAGPGDLDYGVDFQYGRRGSNLKHGSKIAGTSLAMARNTLQILQGSKTSFSRGDDAYQEFDFSVLREAFALLASSKLGAAGANLFMHCGKKVISMADYARAGGQAAAETRDLANAYGANAASRLIMAEQLGIGLPDPDTARDTIAAVERLLQRTGNSFGRYAPSDLGVFLGHRDGAEVKPGLPAAYWVKVGAAPAVAPDLDAPLTVKPKRARKSVTP